MPSGTSWALLEILFRVYRYFKQSKLVKPKFPGLIDMLLIGTASLFGWIFYVNQSFFLYRPGHHQDEVLLPSHSLSTAHLHFSNVTFTSKDGITLNGYWIKAPPSPSSLSYSFSSSSFSPFKMSLKRSS